MNESKNKIEISVIGADGMLGNTVSLYFETKGFSIQRITRNKIDLSNINYSEINSLFRNSKYIINCAGIVKQIIDKFTIEEILKVNTVFPHNLQLISKILNIRCFHITTDCVFSGKKGNYTEIDYTDAYDLYGLSKIGGEVSGIMTLRTSIIGRENKSKKSLLEWAISNAGKTVNGFTNHFWNGLTTLYLADVVYRIIEYDLYREGIFHIHSPEIISKFNLLNYINDIFDLKMKILPVENEIYCNRSLSSIYSLSKDLVKDSIYDQIISLKRFFQ